MPPSDCADALQAVRDTANARRQQHLAIRLAAGLALVHGIRPHETALGPWLAAAHCVTNRDALVQWIRQQLPGLDSSLLVDEPELFSTLSQRLARLLADLTETQPC